MHLYDTTNTLGFTGVGVQYGVALVQRARIDPCKRQRAVTVVHDFECQGSQWAAWINGGNFASFITFKVDFRLRIDFGWVR